MSSELRQWKFGFLNGGELARSLVYPLIEQKVLNPSHIWVAETKEDIREFWQNERNPRVNTSIDLWQVAAKVDIIFLGFDAQSLSHDLDTALLPLLPHENVFKHKLIVSLIPGVTCVELAKKIAEYGLPRPNLQIMRVILNMSMTVGEGLILFCRDEYLTKIWTTPVFELLSHYGMVEEIDESLMDIAASVPALCGPAYVYLMIEAMADGAVKNDLPRDLAIKFVAQVFAGAAKMVLKTGKHPGQLKDEACVPDGPAIDGIHELEIGSVRASLINAADAAAKKLKKQKPQI